MSAVAGWIGDGVGTYWQSVEKLARRGPAERKKTPVDCCWMDDSLVFGHGVGIWCWCKLVGSKNATAFARRSVSGEQVWKCRTDSPGLRCPFAIRPWYDGMHAWTGCRGWCLAQLIRSSMTTRVVQQPRGEECRGQPPRNNSHPNRQKACVRLSRLFCMPYGLVRRLKACYVRLSHSSSLKLLHKHT